MTQAALKQTIQQGGKTHTKLGNPITYNSFYTRTKQGTARLRLRERWVFQGGIVRPNVASKKRDIYIGFVSTVGPT